MDNWKPIPYKVVEKLNDNVYGIQLADGSGPVKNVTRTEILDTGSNLLDQDDENDQSSIEINQVPISQEESDLLKERFVTDKTRKKLDVVLDDAATQLNISQDSGLILIVTLLKY